MGSVAVHRLLLILTGGSGRRNGGENCDRKFAASGGSPLRSGRQPPRHLAARGPHRARQPRRGGSCGCRAAAQVVLDALQDLVMGKLLEQRPETARVVELHAFVDQRAVEGDQGLLNNVFGILVPPKTLVHLVADEPAEAVAEFMVHLPEGRRLGVVDVAREPSGFQCIRHAPCAAGQRHTECAGYVIDSPILIARPRVPRRPLRAPARSPAAAACAIRSGAGSRSRRPA